MNYHLSMIDKINVYDFAWKKNTSKRLTGVLAHEAQAIVSYAGNGEKDAMVDRIVTQAQEEIIRLEEQMQLAYELPPMHMIG